ncbi:unnamed protein product [Adineta ricciae]|uniref:Uncharacterized protein n=1 Tax=Adineta ricciae TaxID=249248 RepID=A0A815Y7D8_ADIRI|nr:unnamed protein product [Adineta ricciae]CAF1566980.1 unnamed protein product [Adineta ricciae]
MSSLTSHFMKLLICVIFLCTFIRTQPLFASNIDDDEQAQIENFLLNNYADMADRYYPTSDKFLDYNQQRLLSPKQAYHSDDVHLAKRIIMLPRVGRRSVPSTSHE